MTRSLTRGDPPNVEEGWPVGLNPRLGVYFGRSNTNGDGWYPSGFVWEGRDDDREPPPWAGKAGTDFPVLNDGNWHRIGLVWDGLYRTLAVDGAVVAEDTQDQLESRAGGFYFGTGSSMGAETFFSGLIDDVRIYNRAMRP